MSRRFETNYRLKSGDNLGDPEFWNRRFEDLDRRVDSNETALDSVDAVADRIEATALQRLDLQITPLVVQTRERLRSLADIFVSSSVSKNTIGKTTQAFTVPESDRLTFATLGYVIADAVSGDAGMGGPVQSFDTETGVLVMSIDYTWGAGSYSAWILTGSPPINAIVAAAQPVIDAQLKTTGDAVATDAITRIAAAQASAQSVLDNAIKTNVVQNLNGGQQKQAKANIGAIGISYLYLSQDTTLQPADAGSLYLCSGGINVTVPATANMKSGTSIILQCWNGDYTTVKIAGGGSFSWHGQGGPSLPIYEGQTAWLFCTGTEWLVFSLDAPFKTTPATNRAQSFSNTQILQFRRNMRLPGTGYIYQLADNTQITVANVGHTLFYDVSRTVFLPKFADCSVGDEIEFFIRVGSVVTLKPNPADAAQLVGDLYSDLASIQLTAGTYTVRRHDSVWRVHGSRVHEKNTILTDRDQSLTQAQKARARLNSGAGFLAAQIFVNTALTSGQINQTFWIGASGVTATLPPTAACVSGDWVEFTNYTSGNATIAANRTNNEASQIYFAGTGGSSPTMTLGPGQSVRLYTDTGSWVAAFRALPVEGGAFLGGVSMPSLTVAGRPIVNPVTGGTSGGDNSDISTASTSRLSYNFVATGTTVIASGSGAVSNNANSPADIYWLLRLQDVSAGNAGVQDKIEVSYAAAVAGSTAPRSVQMFQTTLTLGRTYNLSIWLQKGQAVGPIYPNNLQIQHVNF